MTELAHAQLELDAAKKSKAAVLAQKALQDSNFEKQQVQMDNRINQLQVKIDGLIALQDTVPSGS